MGSMTIIFRILQPKHILLVLKRTFSMRDSFEHPKHMFKLRVEKIVQFSTRKLYFCTILTLALPLYQLLCTASIVLILSGTSGN